jgi:hypothetical protein
VGSENTGELLATEPHPAPIFETGPHPQPLDTGRAFTSLDYLPTPEPPLPVAPAKSVEIPSEYHYVRWWKFVLVVAAVWAVAAAIGLGLFYWWHLLIDKTPAVFVVLVYVVVCSVAGLLLAMVPGRPLISALAIAVMSATFASAIAVAPLYGHYFCQVKGPCLAGIIPY